LGVCVFLDDGNARFCGSQHPFQLETNIFLVLCFTSISSEHPNFHIFVIMLNFFGC